ncbi:MAG: single-stranded DNA-binding protein [Blautia sp.]|nr:single-stranded DNA-binding protein [Blautia sp.]
MNKVILMGRLTRDPEVRYSAGDNSQAVANFTLAVDRRFKRDGEQTADFLRCVSFGRQAEFVERYLHQGSKVVVEGRIQTGSYTNREGQKVYTTDIIVENIEFAESKAASDSYQASRSQQTQRGPAPAASSFDDAGGADGLDGFMNIPDGIEEELPFN